MEEKRNVSELNVLELKALVYDELVKVEVSQNNIKILNQELQKRAQDQKLKPAPTKGEAPAAEAK